MATAARDVRTAMGEWAMSKRDWLPVGYFGASTGRNEEAA